MRRICRSNDDAQALLVRRITEMWAQAARWPGPPDHRGYLAAVAEGMVAAGPAAVREPVRDRLVRLLAAEGVHVSLPDPADWLQWDEQCRR